MNMQMHGFGLAQTKRFYKFAANSHATSMNWVALSEEDYGVKQHLMIRDFPSSYDGTAICFWARGSVVLISRLGT